VSELCWTSMTPLARMIATKLLGSPKVPPMTEKEVVDLTRKTYAGPLVVGGNLIAFRLEADHVV